VVVLLVFGRRAGGLFGGLWRHRMMSSSECPPWPDQSPRPLQSDLPVPATFRSSLRVCHALLQVANSSVGVRNYRVRICQ
jgi:hypothetical protein